MYKKSSFWYLHLPREKIALLQWTLNEYNGLVQFRTIDRFKAIVELMIPPGNELEVEKIIDALRKQWQSEIKIERP
jgi:hypothetical protein